MIIHFFSFYDKIRQISTKKVANIYSGENMNQELFKISHEIKNSLAVMKGYMSLFDGSLEKYQKYTPYLYKSLEHSIELLKDFSDIGKLNVNLDIMDVNYLLEEVIDLYKPIINNIKLICDIDSEIYIEGDYERLKQVFINIIENAMDALKDINSPTFIIKTEAINNEVIITFKDNGYGIDNYTKDNIFTPFYTTKKYGTGLGMYISKEIIKLHNGNIECISDNGVTIKIKLDQYMI